MRRDFQTIADLGFNAVALHHVENRDRLGLMNIAERADLKALVPNRRWRHFLLTGALPEGCGGAPQFAHSLPRQITDHPARGHVAFSVELRPGDAVLFEIF